jgi:hypothetical protein
VEIEMNDTSINRRDFNRLSMAALGGLVAGSVAGCGKKTEPGGTPAAPGQPRGEAASEPKATGDTAAAENPMLVDPHVCRGLNTCKGKGKTGENACAGQGACATAVAHQCASHNECKGQGGCGQLPGQNACKGEGGCAVPLTGDMWEKARAKFEELMTKQGKQIGEPPA